MDDALANDKLRISQATAVIFVRLHRKGLIPPHVTGALTPNRRNRISHWQQTLIVGVKWQQAFL
jgi:hypothetical protein